MKCISEIQDGRFPFIKVCTVNPVHKAWPGSDHYIITHLVQRAKKGLSVMLRISSHIGFVPKEGKGESNGKL